MMDKKSIGIGRFGVFGGPTRTFAGFSHEPDVNR